jgi:hypothetical protein
MTNDPEKGLDIYSLISYINACAELPVELQGTLNILAKATKPALAISSPL